MSDNENDHPSRKRKLIRRKVKKKYFFSAKHGRISGNSSENESNGSNVSEAPETSQAIAKKSDVGVTTRSQSQDITAGPSRQFEI